MGNVRTMWHNQYPVGSSCKLKKLQLWGCENLQTAFPSSFLEGLQSLQILEISSCPSLKEIFEMDSTIVPPLIELYLHSQNPQGYVGFQNLNSLKVSDCTSLKYLFLTSMVKSLVQLEVLEISNCQVEEIVANDQNGLQEAVPLILLFPRLTSLKISYLCNLKRFYQDMYTLGCPLLQNWRCTIVTTWSCCFKKKVLFKVKSTNNLSSWWTRYAFSFFSHINELKNMKKDAQLIMVVLVPESTLERKKLPICLIVY